MKSKKDNISVGVGEPSNDDDPRLNTRVGKFDEGTLMLVVRF